MEEKKFLELANDQFYTLKEEMLDEDRHILGASNEVEYNIEGYKFSISVDGFWEKNTWFDWKVFDENKVVLFSGTED